jgi:cell division protein FtsQ
MSRQETPTRGLPSAGVAGLADKRFKRSDVRPGGRGRSGSWRRRVTRVAVIAGVMAVVVFALGSIVIRARALAIDRLVIHGNHRLSVAEIQVLVSGLRGESILLAHLETYRARLLDSPWVADARLRRLLPSAVEVTIVERVPMAIARLDRQLYLIDTTGVIIDEYGARDAEFDLPIVDGLASSPGGDGSLIDERRARLTASFLAALAVRPALRTRVSQIDVTDAHDVVVILDGDRALLHLGDTQWTERLERYLELKSTLNDKWSDIDYVDLRFGEHIYVLPAHALVGKR